MNKQQLITDLQTYGLQLTEPGSGGRKGGAGPSDHKAVTVDGTTVMVPVYTNSAGDSPYRARFNGSPDQALLEREGTGILPIYFPSRPRFYDLNTAEGIPYWKIALLHSHDVLATTVLQTCMRYADPATACQFCAIGQSLEAGRTIARKSPEQLAEVAEAAVRLDGISQLVMTTGTPHTPDRGAAHLADCAKAVKQRVNLPIQAQCEPPADLMWLTRLKEAGVDSLGMHLEAADPQVRARIMPGKATVPMEDYFAAFEMAVRIFGRGQVSTYLLAGLGDDVPTLLDVSERLIAMGVYPFVVPFVPITGTPLAHVPAPRAEMMTTLYQQIGSMLQKAGLSSKETKAGCAKCGACSALSLFE